MGNGLEAKSAVNGFLNEFKSFQEDIASRLKAQESRLEALDRKSAAAPRPALSRAADVEPPMKKAFAAYVRSGDEDALRAVALEGKALGTATNADGGFLVDPAVSEQVQSVLSSTGSIRAVANVVQIEANSFDVIVDRGDLGSAWSTEASAVAETATPVIERVSIGLHELSALPKASQRLLDDSAFDVEGWLAARIADRFATAEADAFVNGDGADKPKGFLDYASVPNGTEVWGQLGYIATGAAGDFASASPADAIVDLVYSLDALHRSRASFVMNSKTAGAVRKMKDADGRFLWADGLAEGQPPRLMGYPVLIVETMPDIAVDAPAIAFGNFAAGYTIAERPDMRILRDPFSAKPHVLFYATKRVGGDVTDFTAIKLLKFGAS